MKKIAEYIKDKYGPWGWMGQRAHDAAGINNILPLDFILSCDYGSDTGRFFRDEDVFSVEKEQRVRKNWSNEDLNSSLHDDLGRKVFRRWNSFGKRASLLCYRSVEMLEGGIAGLDFPPRILAVPEALKKHFDNKIRFYNMLTERDLPRIPGRVTAFDKENFKDLADEFGLPFVAQFPYGSSGQFTFFIDNEEEFKKLQDKYPSDNIMMAEYLDGFSLNVNAIVISTDNGPRVFCSFPSIQITGNPECGNSPLAFCGNDFSAAKDLSEDMIRQVEYIIRKAGAWMSEEGYRGIFGMDLIVSGGKVYPVEINPRFQNSTSFVSAVNSMDKRKEGSLFLLHIAEFLQEEDPVIKEYLRSFPFDILMDPLDGAQIVLHNRMERGVITGDIPAGIYSFRDGRLVFERTGSVINDCKDRNDILITCAVPGKGIEAEPNAPLCKVQILKEALDIYNKKDFTPETKDIIASVYSGFSVESQTVKV